MRFLTKQQAPLVADNEVNELTKEERDRLKEERDFWDSIVKYADDTTEARRCVEVADFILEERRKRFPL